MHCCVVSEETPRAASMASPICQTCGNKAKKVARHTVAHHLKETHHGAMKDTQYYFCGTPHCAVVYFSNATAQSFTTGDVRIRVGLKETADPIPLCYCFGHTVASVREEIARTGRSTVVARITAGFRRAIARASSQTLRGVAAWATSAGR